MSSLKDLLLGTLRELGPSSLQDVCRQLSSRTNANYYSTSRPALLRKVLTGLSILSKEPSRQGWPQGTAKNEVSTSQKGPHMPSPVLPASGGWEAL